MPITQEQLEELRAEHFAEDLPIEARMTAWTESQARHYFEHAEEPPDDSQPWAPMPEASRPPPPAPTPPVALKPNAVSGVELTIPTDPDPLLLPEPIPLRGNRLAARDAEAEATIQWMCQKAALRQDMFLVADAPGGRARALAFEFCRRARRACRYLALTRDTTESDLKQRREIVGGALQFVDQPPIAAARHGDVLILEGVEQVQLAENRLDPMRPMRRNEAR